MKTTTGRDPRLPAGVDLTRLPAERDEQRFERRTGSEQREMLAYLRYRLEVDTPGHGRSTTSLAATSYVALFVATLSLLMQISGPGTVWLGNLLAATAVLAVTALIYGMFWGARVDRRRGFTRAWLETLEKVYQESESMPK